jgi:hypothetical protein
MYKNTSTDVFTRAVIDRKHDDSCWAAVATFALGVLDDDRIYCLFENNARALFSEEMVNTALVSATPLEIACVLASRLGHWFPPHLFLHYFGLAYPSMDDPSVTYLLGRAAVDFQSKHGVALDIPDELIHALVATRDVSARIVGYKLTLANCIHSAPIMRCIRRALSARSHWERMCGTYLCNGLIDKIERKAIVDEWSVHIAELDALLLKVSTADRDQDVRSTANVARMRLNHLRTNVVAPPRPEE